MCRQSLRRCNEQCPLSCLTNRAVKSCTKAAFRLPHTIPRLILYRDVCRRPVPFARESYDKVHALLRARHCRRILSFDAERGVQALTALSFLEGSEQARWRTYPVLRPCLGTLPRARGLISF
jgi:hypothetical protein